jgi:hypothetical protein
MEGDTSDNFDFLSTWTMRSDKSEHTSSVIFWLGSGDDATDNVDCSLPRGNGNLDSSIEADKFKA